VQVFLIRHTTPNIAKGLIYGRCDVPLTDTFDAEKTKVIEALPAIDLVYSSPLSRCTRLAEAVSPNFIPDERLYELNFGDWENQTWETINRRDSELWLDDFVNRCPPKGETLLQMQARVLHFWTELKSGKADTVAIVTHAGVIRILLAHLNNMPLSSFFEIKVGYGEVFRVEI
jgi:alpha-ribazole phosphatase